MRMLPMHLQENLLRDSLRKIANIVKDQKTLKDDVQASKKNGSSLARPCFPRLIKGKLFICLNS